MNLGFVSYSWLRVLHISGSAWESRNSKGIGVFSTVL